MLAVVLEEVVADTWAAAAAAAEAVVDVVAAAADMPPLAHVLLVVEERIAYVASVSVLQEPGLDLREPEPSFVAVVVAVEAAADLVPDAALMLAAVLETFA